MPHSVAPHRAPKAVGAVFRFANHYHVAHGTCPCRPKPCDVTAHCLGWMHYAAPGGMVVERGEYHCDRCGRSREEDSDD